MEICPLHLLFMSFFVEINQIRIKCIVQSSDEHLSLVFKMCGCSMQKDLYDIFLNFYLHFHLRLTYF